MPRPLYPGLMRYDIYIVALNFLIPNNSVEILRSVRRLNHPIKTLTVRDAVTVSKSLSYWYELNISYPVNLINGYRVLFRHGQSSLGVSIVMNLVLRLRMPFRGIISCFDPWTPFAKR